VTAQPSPWPARRERAQELRDRHAFVAEVLTLYLALVDVQEEAWGAARASAPTASELCAWTAAEVVPGVVEATVAAGPAALAQAVRDRAAEDALAGWLEGAELDPVDRYLARASLGPVLEALHEGARTPGANGAGDGAQRCPHCGGLPQVAYLAASGEALVTGGRSLSCSRCGSSWSSSRSACPACGETDEAQLVVYAERWQGNGDSRLVFPHLRVAGCATCNRYLIDVDLERDGHAVPEVDELAALPLDLYAADQGLTKLTANLMGF
jgi:FdhE protein